MKTCIYVPRNYKQIDFVKFQIDEILLSSNEFSRFSKFNNDELLEQYSFFKDKNIKMVLDFDLLLEESKFSSTIDKFKSLPPKLTEHVRLIDSGLVSFIKANYPKTKIQLSLEVGNHNQEAVQSWINYLGSSLDRIILSSQLSKEKIHEYILKYKDVKFEILGHGRSLIFYTPRKLLGHLLEEEERGPYIEMKASSEESAHKGFPVIENTHGSFMFNTKDFSILSHVDELKLMDLSYFRVDTRFDETDLLLPKILEFMINQSTDLLNEIVAAWPAKTLPGFFRVNKTNVLFKKLKNMNLQDRGNNFIGEVVDYSKGEFLAVSLKDKMNISLGDEIELRSPQGKEKTLSLAWIKSIDGASLDSVIGPAVILIPPVNGFSAKSYLYLINKK